MREVHKPNSRTEIGHWYTTAGAIIIQFKCKKKHKKNSTLSSFDFIINKKHTHTSFTQSKTDWSLQCLEHLQSSGHNFYERTFFMQVVWLGKQMKQTYLYPRRGIFPSILSMYFILPVYNLGEGFKACLESF